MHSSTFNNDPFYSNGASARFMETTNDSGEVVGLAVRLGERPETEGQLGTGTPDNVGDDETPQSAGMVPLGGKAIDIDTRHNHTCAVLDSGTVRARFPFVISRRNFRCGRATPTITSRSCSPAISETRRPQQQARRTMMRFRRALADRSAFFFGGMGIVRNR